jgi:hypothetical protein
MTVASLSRNKTSSIGMMSTRLKAPKSTPRIMKIKKSVSLGVRRLE